MYNRTYNFSAGPATMPVPVLEEIRDELLNYRGAGMGVMEMSHRSKEMAVNSIFKIKTYHEQLVIKLAAIIGAPAPR